MRVLMTSLAVEAHFNGTVPLAWALRAAGHEVRFASQPALTKAITQAGLTAVPVGADHTHHEIVRDLGEELTGFYRDIDFTGQRGGPRDRKAANSLLTATFYAQANNDSMVDELVAYARWWQPDLVIWEPFSFAGGVAARACGAAGARLLWGPDLFGLSREGLRADIAALPPERRDDALEEWLTWTLARHGLDYDERVVTGHFTIDQMPEGVRLPSRAESIPMRYVPYNGLSAVPDWLRENPIRPRICLTLGITSRDMAYPNLISPGELFDAVADLDVEIVATLNEAQAAEVGPVPGNTRVVDFVPLHALMPTCAAIVHHGGAGTWSTAAVYGVPQLVVAGMWDNVYRAERLSELGAGIYLPPHELTGNLLREGVLRLLEEPAFRSGAQALRDRMLAEPSPGEVVESLVDAAARYSPQLTH
ncbi:glycosyltransferase/glycosyltransferase/glycosyltransferase DesVII/glycosyltransferase OleGII [Nocardia tenerifensis]|uniref:Glycosyltransferase/glycosyltransferase/glycosyl transferase DesVII/glycosyltransferase OleGII n=1 Tax=Nocardia tenerifensis TaxID=228006 RepID=A0A318JZ76_9NOCA|nr:activator-dependent family glycosyltransferase [Nocardia tenerifensis]PXX59771.1 glycosyltransferase/glycosyltransferase/glycosyltransferase DesVII/glycosyltransferase OleGII [Nocardia tenerifensis]